MNKRNAEIKEWVNDSDFGFGIYTDKYIKDNETLAQFAKRVGGTDDIAQMIVDSKMIFGGRIMANRGIDNDMSFSNCFKGDTKIVTRGGLEKLEDLVGKNIEVYDKTNKFVEATVKKFGEQELYRLTLTNGREIMVTSDHLWFARNSKPTAHSNKYVEMKTSELKDGSLIKVMSDGRRKTSRINMSNFGIAHGIFFGDGSHKKEYNHLTLCGDKKEMVKYFNGSDYKENNNGDYELLTGLPNFFNDAPINETRSYKLGFVAGYFATDGSVTKNRAVITSTEKSNLEAVNSILASMGIPTNQIMIHDRISNLTNKPSRLFRLTLDTRSLPKSFFINSKHEICESEDSKYRNVIVKSIEKTNITETVYCAVVPSSESFCLEGNILTHNCATKAYIRDSIDDIAKVQSDLMNCYKSGQGVGLCLTNIRPKGALAGRNGNTTGGVVPFAKIFDNATENTSAGSSGRRGK